jgi:hypothetical protein
MSNSPEVQTGGGIEKGVETRGAAAERSEKLAEAIEKRGEQSPEQKAERVESARAEAQEALLSKERGGAEKKQGGDPTPSAIRRVTKREKDVAYERTLKEIRSQMNAPSRAFSKVIHAPFIEKTSEAVGSTVARPNAILAGSLSALILVSGVYWVAKTYGYPLSGFETIGAFILGWMIGLMVDYFRIMATGGRPR